jgi:hypothetical protein
LLQALGGTHALPPQVQVPALQLTQLPRQVTQAPPLSPQKVVESAVSQMPFVSQQPETAPHEATVHLQVPFEQVKPLPQGGLVPHWQPPLTQVSAIGTGEPALQFRQVPPLAPQEPASVTVTQVVPEQHPVEHELELHTQFPPTHCWPAAHAGPLPQAHVPLLQLSAVEPQLPQIPPSIPQAPVVFPVWQALSSQHPVGHAAPVQRQVPPTHSSPAPHGALLPHAQPPSAAQLSELGTLGFESQLMQVAPGGPHCEAVVGSTQLAPAQHPASHEAALQTHRLPEHC